MRRFLLSAVPDLGERAQLPDDAAHHFRDVLRGRLGDRVELFDGRGTRAVAEVVHITGQDVVARVESVHTEDPSTAVVLVLSVLKGPAMDAAVRMATEAGATAIWPVVSARTVATGDRSSRWNRIAAGAAQQCGRATVPSVSPPRPFLDALSDLRDHTLYIAHTGVDATANPAGHRAILIGPEGGWTTDEVQAAVRAGAHPVRLGPYVLRADTAAAVGTSWLRA